MGSTTSPRPWLDDAAAAAFLADHWQRAARFFRGALTHLPEAPEWRALAADPEVESRRIVTLDGPVYRAQSGPITGPDPDEPWTVLVQDADTFWPPLRPLFDTLPFLPRWRTEDIMMSAASDGGSVGPHVDRYDVFLVQATGQRHWQIGHRGTGIPDPDATELRLVAPFEPAFEVTASPGDVLYLPPGVPHHGVARGDCTTYSIGFRAPSLQDLAAVALEHVDGAALLADPERHACTDRDAIDPATVNALRAQLSALMADERALVHALGELITEPKAWLAPEPPENEPQIGPDDRLQLACGARLATWAADTLFVNGTGYAVSCEDEQRLIRTLAGGGQIRAGDVAGASALVEALLADGALEMHSEDGD